MERSRSRPGKSWKSRGLVTSNLAAGADVFIVNKFGKHEAEGRGFRTVIAEAIAMGIPVIVGVNGLNRQPFEHFAEGLAVCLTPDCGVLADWVIKAIEPAVETV